MTYQIKTSSLPRLAAALLVLISIAMIGGCANYAGIYSNKQMAIPSSFATTRSLPAESGPWPSAEWAEKFGGAQLTALIDEALKGSPTLEMARARLAAAAAASEGATANTLPRVSAGASVERQRFTGNGLVPPPYAGSWQTENNALVSASYDLDLWGKNREALKSAVSTLRASEAETAEVELTLSIAIARDYNELARLYALHDIATRNVAQRQRVLRLTMVRVKMGLDTEVEQRAAEADVASAQVAVAEWNGDIRRVRYQLGALLGKGPDRGLAIARPQPGADKPARLPENLPADLVSRRPDIVAARWRVEATIHHIAIAKAEFFPDINLGAMVGLSSLGFSHFLSLSSRSADVGPAIHLPIFDGGALRAQLKGRYAAFNYAVANYNRTLLNALSQVAIRLSEIRAIDNQLQASVRAQDAIHEALQLALAQYKAGLTTQLTVLNAQHAALASDQQVVNLRLARRDRQIALVAALGGGYHEAQPSTP